MAELVIRRSDARDDINAMKSLWAEVFGDPEDLIDDFFATLYAPGRALLALEGDALLGCVYLLPGAALVSGSGERESAVYFYALAVTPTRRGEGIGAALTAQSAALCREAGAALCLMPGEESLRAWYAERSGFADLSAVQTALYPVLDNTPEITLRPVSAADYAAKREALLAHIAHAAMPEEFFRFQERLCARAHGALLEIVDANGKTGLACVEIAGNCAEVKELLFDGDIPRVAGEIAVRFGAAVCRVSYPGDAYSAVMALGAKTAPGLWWGPVFD